MFFREVIYLITVSTTNNTLGNAIDTDTKKTVYADETGVKSSEFYQALATGLKPEKSFVIRSIDYANEQYLEHNSKRYRIIRTYNKDGEMLEIVCTSVVGHEVKSWWLEGLGTMLLMKKI